MHTGNRCIFSKSRRQDMPKVRSFDGSGRPSFTVSREPLSHAGEKQPAYGRHARPGTRHCAAVRTRLARRKPAEPAPNAPARMASQSIDQLGGNPPLRCATARHTAAGASIIPASMPKANPGDSFFDFANGPWDARTVIPADKSRFGVFDVLTDKTQEQVRAIIEDSRQVSLARHRRRQDRRALQRVHGRSADRTARRRPDRRRSRQNPRRQDQGRHRRPDGSAREAVSAAACSP